MARIVLTSLGTLGDLHPYLAIGVELRRRGHSVVVATHPDYRSRAESAGLEFAPVGPALDACDDLPALMRAAMDERTGSEVVVRRFVLPFLRESRDHLLTAAHGADLVVDHMLTIASPLVTEKLGILRVSSTLQPLATFTSLDPPIIPGVPFLAFMRRFGGWPWRAFWTLGRISTRHWFRELEALRAEMGLPPSPLHPLLQNASSTLHLMLFSRELMAPQQDWPPASVQTGFPVHDRGESGESLPPALGRWLDAGPPPLVFTLGSSAVWTAGSFYDEAARAARALGQRAVLLTGSQDLNPVAGVPRVDDAPLAAPIVTVDYAPHSEVMPRGLATIHQGGVGTTAQALLAGRPMLVVPFSHDQPDNAARCARLGVARVLPRTRISAAAFTRELGALIADRDAETRAQQVAARMRGEPGAAGAVDAIERVLAAHRLPMMVAPG